jgi:hypothetical protein
LEGAAKGGPVWRARAETTLSTSAPVGRKKAPFLAMSNEDERDLRAQLAALREEHSALDAAIAAIVEARERDQLQLTRLKKRKLQLKDQMARIEDALLPDISA